MEFVRTGEALLRSSQPLLPFLAPSAYRASAPRRISQCLHQHHRALSTTTRRRSETDSLSRMLDQTLDQNKSVPTAPTGRTSRVGSRLGQQHNRNNTSPSTPQRDRSSIDDILTDIRNPTRSSATTNNNAARDSADEISRLLDAGMALNPNQAQAVAPSTPLPPPTPPFKLNSSVGRTIEVNENRGMDVGRAFRTLEARCAQNSVKRDFMRQRFYERPGLKRKRLASERWRRRFKENFRATIKLVQGLKKQGW